MLSLMLAWPFIVIGHQHLGRAEGKAGGKREERRVVFFDVDLSQSQGTCIFIDTSVIM